MQIVAELSINHQGDEGLAADMVREAAAAGADIIKTQHYMPHRLNPADPQREAYLEAWLDKETQLFLKAVAEEGGATFMSTPFCAESLAELRGIGLTHFKIASSESGNDWWQPLAGETWFVSLPWGHGSLTERAIHLTAIPLYPTPLECVGQAMLRDGWSDHCEGLSACEWAIANGAKAIEVHFGIPGNGRNCVWDKTAEDIRRLRAFADDVQTMTSGVATKFRNRWRGAA